MEATVKPVILHANDREYLVIAVFLVKATVIENCMALGLRSNLPPFIM